MSGPPANGGRGETGIEKTVPRDRRSELIVSALLIASGAMGAATVVVYVLGANTQLLGTTFGGALMLSAAALILVGKRVVPQETVAEKRAALGHPEEEAAAAAVVKLAGEGVTRRRLLLGAAGVAGVGVGAAALVPVASLGPWMGDRSISSPWSAGVSLVDEHGAPITADMLEPGGFLTAFAQGASIDSLGASVMVVRLSAGQLHLPAARRGWAPRGLVAYSKICTHAGCAVAMLRDPLFDANAPGPALVCPCHYSTFDVTTGGTVVFGPAGRPLPQLPLGISTDGTLKATGPLSGDIGPAWFGTHAPDRSGGW